MRKTAIIIPCYNEATRLESSKIIDFIKNNPDMTFIFVNDGSTDNTFEMLQSVRSEILSQVHIVNFDQNAGKAEAVRHGILKALDMPFDYIGYWDADLSTPLSTINEFCDLLDKHQGHAVIGARVKLLGRNVQRQKTRHYLGRIFATIASNILKLPVYDTQCGAKLFKKSPYLCQVFSTPFKVNWAFDIEIMARFMMITEFMEGPDMTTAIIEHPLREWIHKEGSKVKPFDFVKAPLELLRLFSLLYVPFVSSKYKNNILKGMKA